MLNIFWNQFCSSSLKPRSCHPSIVCTCTYCGGRKFNYNSYKLKEYTTSWLTTQGTVIYKQGKQTFCAHYDRCLNMVVVNVHFGAIINFFYYFVFIFNLLPNETYVLIVLQFPTTVNDDSSMCWNNKAFIDMSLCPRTYYVNDLLTRGVIKLHVIKIMTALLNIVSYNKWCLRK